ncbi:MAG: HEAT repeat domain-containing protein [Myxococcales bacterium]|nr:HEAT repeat domain-containing protein [Myxococcales bacterium]
MRHFLLFLFLSACTPTACSEEEQETHREVEILIGEPGPAVKEAERRLLERGRSAIAILETGLYHADPIGRIRIVRTLAKLEMEEAMPVIQHIAERDDDPLVRETAEAALRKTAIVSPTE